jgi:hypothetical protein
MLVASTPRTTNRHSAKTVFVSLYRKQADCIQSNAVYRGFVSGIGAGKSFTGSYDLLRRAKPGRLYMIAGPTYGVLNDASVRSFLKLARKLGRLVSSRRGSEPQATFRCVNGGIAEVIFRTAKDPENLRGPNLSGVWLDEASLTKRAAYDILIGRLREGGEQGWMLCTYTPKGKRHWTYEVFGDPDGVEVARFHAKTAENPFLHETFNTRLTKQYSARLAKQELEGLELDTDGGIPLEWLLACQDEECLWKDERPPAGKWPELYIGIDVGRSRDRSVIWVDEKVGDVLCCRVCKVLQNVPFQEQFKIASSFIGLTGVVKARIDKGYNPQLAEDLERKFGAKVEGVSLGAPRQAELFNLIENAAEKRTMRIPVDDENDVINDFMLVSAPDLSGGTLKIKTERDEDLGHADRFWAKSLAASAAREGESQKVIFARPAFGPRKR